MEREAADAAGAPPAPPTTKTQGPTQPPPQSAAPAVECGEPAAAALLDLPEPVLLSILQLCSIPARCRLSASCRRLRASALPSPGAPALAAAACGGEGCGCAREALRAPPEGCRSSWLFVFPRQREGLALELLEALSHQAEELYGRRVAPPLALRVCSHAEAAALVAACRPALADVGLIVGLNRPDGLEGALRAAGAAAPLVSVASRHALRMPLRRYASAVLLPRLQAGDLLQHALEP